MSYLQRATRSEAPIRTIVFDAGLGVLTVGVVYVTTFSGNLIFGTTVLGLLLVFLTGYTTGVATNQSVGLLGAITRTHGGDDHSEPRHFRSFLTALPIGSVRSFLFLYGAGMVIVSLIILIGFGHTLT